MHALGCKPQRSLSEIKTNSTAKTEPRPPAVVQPKDTPLTRKRPAEHSASDGTSYKRLALSLDYDITNFTVTETRRVSDLPQAVPVPQSTISSRTSPFTSFIDGLPLSLSRAINIPLFIADIGLKSIQDVQKLALCIRTNPRVTTDAALDPSNRVTLSFTQWVIFRHAVLRQLPSDSLADYDERWITPDPDLARWLDSCSPPLARCAASLHTMGFSYYDIQLLQQLTEEQEALAKYLVASGVFSGPDSVGFFSMLCKRADSSTSRITSLGFDVSTVRSFANSLGLGPSATLMAFGALVQMGIRNRSDLDRFCLCSQEELDQVLDHASVEGLRWSVSRAIVDGLKARADEARHGGS